MIPWIGVPEALLSDRGTNLLSHLMQDICQTLGISKLNTTAYHPQCDVVVKRFNRTLKCMLRKHAFNYGEQWDTYLPLVVWAYRNVPHEATREKPCFLLFGMDCCTPLESMYLPPTDLIPTDTTDYRQALISHSAMLENWQQVVFRKHNRSTKYNMTQTVKRCTFSNWRLGFPHEDTGKFRKLSRPWHGPF